MRAAQLTRVRSRRLGEITIGKYSVMVTGVPKGQAATPDLARKVKAHFENITGEGSVHEVSITTQNGLMLTLLEYKAECVDHRRSAAARINRTRGAWGGYAYDYYASKVALADDEMARLMSNKSPNPSVAFVTFTSVAAKEQLLLEYLNPFKFFLWQPAELRFQGRHRLWVVAAPEPDDLYWSHLPFPAVLRYFRQMSTHLISIVWVRAPRACAYLRCCADPREWDGAPSPSILRWSARPLQRRFLLCSLFSHFPSVLCSPKPLSFFQRAVACRPPQIMLTAIIITVSDVQSEKRPPTVDLSTTTAAGTLARLSSSTLHGLTASRRLPQRCEAFRPAISRFGVDCRRRCMLTESPPSSFFLPFLPSPPTPSQFCDQSFNLAADIWNQNFTRDLEGRAFLNKFFFNDTEFIASCAPQTRPHAPLPRPCAPLSSASSASTSRLLLPPPSPPPPFPLRPVRGSLFPFSRSPFPFSSPPPRRECRDYVGNGIFLGYRVRPEEDDFVPISTDPCAVPSPPTSRAAYARLRLSKRCFAPPNAALRKPGASPAQPVTSSSSQEC